MELPNTIHNYYFFRKENTVLRARVNHHRVSVIPNAVDTTAFVPKLELRTKNKSKTQSHSII